MFSSKPWSSSMKASSGFSSRLEDVWAPMNVNRSSTPVRVEIEVGRAPAW